MKGAVLMIEDWWIRIMEKRKRLNSKNNDNNNGISNKNVDRQKLNKKSGKKNNNANKNKKSLIFQLRPKKKNKIINYVSQNKADLNSNVHKIRLLSPKNNKIKDDKFQNNNKTPNKKNY